jgi:hypothetical protein
VQSAQSDVHTSSLEDLTLQRTALLTRLGLLGPASNPAVGPSSSAPAQPRPDGGASEATHVADNFNDDEGRNGGSLVATAVEAAASQGELQTWSGADTCAALTVQARQDPENESMMLSAREKNAQKRLAKANQRDVKRCAQG